MDIDLDEMKLRMLAEFDDEDLADVFDIFAATLPHPSGSPSELALFCSALLALVSTDVFVLGLGKKWYNPERDLDKQESLRLAAEMPAWFRFDAEQSYWNLADGQIGRDVIPIVILTELGKAKALDVRINHGFRWWTKRGESKR